jgi:hypothetical protein
MDDLLGVAEVCEPLCLSRGALDARRRRKDFPEPAFVTRATPLWWREQLVEYARSRVSRLEERPAIERLAEEGEWLDVAEAAAMIGLSEASLRAIVYSKPWPNGFRFNLQSGEPVSVSRLALGAIAERPAGRSSRPPRR